MCAESESSMLTSSSIKPKVNGFGWYHAVTRELFHAKTVYFHHLNTCKRVPFHLGMDLSGDGDDDDEEIIDESGMLLCLYIKI